MGAIDGPDIGAIDGVEVGASDAPPPSLADDGACDNIGAFERNGVCVGEVVSTTVVVLEGVNVGAIDELEVGKDVGAID